MPPVRLIPLLGLSLLTACAQQPAHNVTLEDQSDCPQQLHVGQQLILSLPSNPTTGYRWAIQDSAGGVLRSLGPEVYSTPDDDAVIGAAGHSTWRFQAAASGEATLRLAYQRTWEPEPIEHFECRLEVL